MIEYTASLENIRCQMLEGFFEGWQKPRTPEEHLVILQNSTHIILAIDSQQSTVVGFITALSDRIQAAFIPLLEVLPGYRKQAIGSTLASRMLEKLKGIPAIDLTCDPALQGFYSKLGMVPSVGMIIRHY